MSGEGEWCRQVAWPWIAFSLKWESWTGVQRAFAVKSFNKNKDSYVAARREIRKKFGIHRNSKLPSAHAVKTSVNNFEDTGSTVKKKGGSDKTVRTPQNVERASFEQSPRRSAVRPKKLGLSESTSHWSCGYRKRFHESRSTCYVGSWVVFTVGLLSVNSVMDGILRVKHFEWIAVLCFYVLCYVSRPLIHLFLQMLKYVLPHKCNCIMISNTLNFLTLKNRPIRWRILYKER